MRKGIILAGGSGSRMYPLTYSVSKQLLPVYDKPMIYYSLSTLMLSGITQILVITTPHDHDNFKHLLGDGSKWGICLEYAIQPSPDGLAQAFIIGKDFIKNNPVTLILGDNIFYGEGLSDRLQMIARQDKGATIFGYYVKDPKRYGVVGFDSKGRVTSLEEKPESPKSNYAVTGLYYYDNDVIQIAKQIKPSARGELEITDINNTYLAQGNLDVELFGRGTAWLDTGTHESLLDAATFIKVVADRQGLKIACPEEIAFRMKLINANQLEKIAGPMKKNGYGQYLLDLLNK
ncbi:MAG: glucose-1-phosphate thymidylyltransferase RfbA [Desulfobacula sp.]|nr:glucose-1-phosphate thymidylyltransferase RfbA [Desulfobacula sp.]